MFSAIPTWLSSYTFATPMLDDPGYKHYVLVVIETLLIPSLTLNNVVVDTDGKL